MAATRRSPVDGTAAPADAAAMSASAKTNPVHHSSRLLFTVFGSIYDVLTDHPLWAAQNAALLDRCGPLPDDARVLDVGAGTGIGTLAVAKRLSPRATVVGVDLTEAMVARARAIHARDGAALPNVSFARADASAMPQLPSQHFDAVLANSFLYLLPDKEAVLRELYRVLRPGGQLVMMEPHAGGSWTRAAVRSVPHHIARLPTQAVSSLRLGASMTAWRVMSGAAGRLSKEQMRRLFEAAGFVDVACHDTLGGLGVHVVATRPPDAADGHRC